MAKPALSSRKFHPVLYALLILGLVCTWLLASHLVQAGQEDDFSFLVYGDTRSEPYIIAGQAQSSQIEDLLRKRYPVAPQLFFDPLSGQLERMVVSGGAMKNDTTTFFYRDGWPWLATSEGKVIMRREGRDWVQRRVTAQLEAGTRQPGAGAQFVVHTGDVQLWGYQGQDLDSSPGWQDFYDNVLMNTPPADPSLGLPGRVFPALGNHEVWGDEDIQGLLTTMPYLAQMGLSSKQRMYSFDFRGCRFIFLDSGTYKTTGGEGWYSDQPDFKAQMRALTNWLQDAQAKRIQKVFITFHKPAFCISGHGPLPEGDNPHPFIKPFAKNLDITVFNGHVHTTELYEVDGVRYLLLGAGGAPQVTKASTPPAGYPQELYWRGQPRVEEYNYLRVSVTSKGNHMFLHRFRPGDPARPFEKVELFRPAS